jgi:outer membrane protein assembly factor BamB
MRSFEMALSKSFKMNWIYLPVLFVALIVVICFMGCSNKTGQWQSKQKAPSASALLSEMDVSRGIVAVVGDSLADYSIELARLSELVVYLQLDNDNDVFAARKAVDDAGFYGERIYVEKGSSERIHLADNIADALVVVNDSEISENEALRILRPEGKAFLAGQVMEKPFPNGIDDWSHPFHGPDNNTQSEDTVVKAPYLTQFFAEPYYAPVTQVTVASAGKVFKGFGNVAFHEREEPFLNQLVAFNGYNGTMLWKRDLTPGTMLHRNTMIATPDILYWGDDKSCKMLSTKTGNLMDEIIPDIDRAGGTFWKWMGMDGDVLYALIGDQEAKDPVMRWRRQQHGWPWTGISEGFNKDEHTWGFGQNLLAIDVKSKKIKWRYFEENPIDSRALTMKNGRIYVFHFGQYLKCLNAKSGKTIWSKTLEDSPELFEALGTYLPRQSWETNWRTRNYMMASDDALYFAGPQMDKLLAVSTKDGSVLWQDPYNNFQLVLRDDGLYGISGPWGNNVSKKFEPLTGKVLAELPTGRRACTRPNGASDAIFFRASGGTIRFDVDSESPKWISPMRPSCHDGVTIANGLLYWWPFVCDCQLSIYGFVSIGAAGDYEFGQSAENKDRLETFDYKKTQANLLETTADWTSFRKDIKSTSTSAANIAKKGSELWAFPSRDVWKTATDVLGHARYIVPTAPVTCDGITIYAGSDGIVRAIDVQTGNDLWTCYTGGSVRIAPTIWKDRVLVGSGDGWVYNIDIQTGEKVWRFRAAPLERKIPVYGSLQSTWPVASGVLVENDIVYLAAGIVNYDGIHVYALDAKTGSLVWQNNNSGHLLPEAQTGASVMGHMLINDGKLYLASGTSLSPAIYDITNGTCLNDPAPLERNKSFAPRGWELYLIGDHVVASGKPFYSHPRYDIYDPTVTNKLLHSKSGNRDVVWVNQKKIICYPPIKKETLNNSVKFEGFAGYKSPVWGKLDLASEPYWEYTCNESKAIAVCKNAVVLAEETELIVLDLKDGKVLWTQPLEYPPVEHGIAVSRDGRILLTLDNGSIHCYGGKSTAPTPFVNSGNTFFVGSSKIAIASNVPGTDIYYTLDGSEPTKSSNLYTNPILVKESCQLKMRGYSNNNVPGFVVSEDLKRVEYEQVSDPGNIIPGLEYDFFKSSFWSVSDMDDLEPTSSGIFHMFKVNPPPDVNRYGYIYRGYIIAPSAGVYTFYITSNDGSKLYINDQELIDNDGGHGAIEKSAQIALKPGEYPIMVKYFQMGGGQALNVSWEGPGFRKKEIKAEALFHINKKNDAV